MVRYLRLLSILTKGEKTAFTVNKRAHEMNDRLGIGRSEILRWRRVMGGTGNTFSKTEDEGEKGYKNTRHWAWKLPRE